MKRLKGKVATGLIVAMLVSTLNAPGSSLAQVPEEEETVLGIATASDADKKGYEIATNSNASEDDEADELFEEELINDLEEEEGNDLEDEELSLGKASDSNANAAFYYVQEVDGYVISLSAEDGILPENTVAQVELIEGEEEKDIKETIEAQAYDKKIVDKAVTFDITFWNDAEEVEPENGNVTVAIQLSKEMTEAAKDSNAQVSVFDTASVDEVNSVETSVNTPIKVVYDMESPSMFTISLLAVTNEKGQTVIHAANAEEFVAAVRSNTEIVLEGKTYDLTRTENGIEVNRLSIEEIDNLTIKGQIGTRIVSDSGSDVILQISACRNLVIENAIIGHDLSQKPQFGCDENVGVIDATESEITITNCDIFGCGWMGITAKGCALTMNDSKIRDCSSYIADIKNSYYVWDTDDSFHEEEWKSDFVEKTKSVFNNCQFYGNGYAVPFPVAVTYIGNADDIIFNQCNFSDNYNPNFCGNIDYRKTYWDWDEENSKYVYTDHDGNEISNPATFAKHPVLKNCTFTKNAWQKAVEVYYAVTFLDDEGNVYKTVRVKAGDCVQMPENPISPKPGYYVFNGWTYGSELYDFTQPVISNIRLYASWKVIKADTDKDSDSSYDKTVGVWNSYGENVKCWLNGKMCADGVYTITKNGKKNQYYFDKNGNMQVGWVNGHYYSPVEGNDYGADITSASLALGSFGYAGSFSNDIWEESGFIFSLKKWKDGLNAIGSGTIQYLKNLINGEENPQWKQSVSDAFMQNPEYTKKMIASLVNKKFETTTSYSGDAKKQTDTYKDTVDLIDSLIDNYFDAHNDEVKSAFLQGLHEGISDGADMLSYMKMGLKDADYLEACAMNYTENLLYLNDLQKSLGADTTLGKAVEEVKKDYENHFMSRIGDVITSSVKTLSEGDIKIPDLTTEAGRQKAITGWVDDVLNTKFKLVDAGIQLVTDQMPSIDAVDTVVYSSYMRTEAIFALKKAEENLTITGRTGQSLAEYEAAFDMAKMLTTKQYEAMLSYYESKAYAAWDKQDQIDLIQNEIKKLNTITYENYHCNGVLR